MGRHLNRHLWFSEIPTAAGTIAWRAKRVSAKRERQFPKRYRDFFQLHGPSKLCKRLMEEYNIGLADAWAMVKRMFGDSTYECPPVPERQPAAYRQWSTKWQSWDYADKREDLPRPQDPAEPLYP